MKTTAKIFVISILIPAVVLGWMALRAAMRQEEVIVRQEAQIRQVEVDQWVAAINREIQDKLISFQNSVNARIAEGEAWALARGFSQWQIPKIDNYSNGIPFAVDLRGRMLSPLSSSVESNARISNFLRKHEGFLVGEASAEVYVGYGQLNQPELQPKVFNKQTYRNVIPEQTVANANFYQVPTELNAEKSRFAELIEGEEQGVIARFIQDDLELLFWARAPQSKEENLIFGWSCSPEDILRREFFENTTNLKPKARFDSVSRSSGNICFAILDDKGQVYAQNPEGLEMDWKRPFVAAEIGSFLPHWEIAAYLIDPGVLDESARLVKLSLFTTVAVALGAMLVGCFFVYTDVRRQAALAQKKTDFVSNVSHELKTPLTSIRMFAELLKNGANKDSEKADRFLDIIVADSERLTRLINNVLDFSKLERGKKQFQKEEFDLKQLLNELWQTHGTHLKNRGFTVEFKSGLDTLGFHGDPDAIAQVVVNLLSNAEKYSDEQKEVSMILERLGNLACIQIMDRGIGVPVGSEKKIFEQFYRAHDSLASGIQGSGLGLTLASQIVAEHGGRIEYIKREGGGSIFSISLPIE